MVGFDESAAQAMLAAMQEDAKTGSSATAVTTMTTLLTYDGVSLQDHARA